MFITDIWNNNNYKEKHLIGFEEKIARKLMKYYPEVMRKDGLIYFTKKKEVIEKAKEIKKELKK